jgi:hypothetical protein
VQQEEKVARTGCRESDSKIEAETGDLAGALAEMHYLLNLRVNYGTAAPLVQK